MADLATLERALRNADAAGDTAAARRFAGEIQRVRAQQAGTANVSGSFLPMSRDDKGNLQFDSNAGILGQLKSAFSLPGDAYAGKVNPTSDEAIGRAADFAAFATPVTPPMRNPGMAGVYSMDRQAKVKPPTAEALKADATSTYDALGKSGLEYSVSSVDDLSRTIQNELAQEGIGDEIAGKTYSILKKLQTPPDGAVSVPFATGINTARKSLQRIGSAVPEERVASKIASDRILSWIEGDGNGGIISGPSGAGPALKRANANYAAAKRSDLLTGIEDVADLKAASANSGRNADNAIRQRIVGLLTNKNTERDRSGFSKNELAGLEKVARGSAPSNWLRAIGNYLGGGGGLAQLSATGAAGTIGFAAGGPVGAAIGSAGAYAAGTGAKSVADALTRSALGKMDKTVRSRSPLFAEMQAAAPSQQLVFDARQALAKALMARMLQQDAEPTPR